MAGIRDEIEDMNKLDELDEVNGVEKKKKAKLEQLLELMDESSKKLGNIAKKLKPLGVKNDIRNFLVLRGRSMPISKLVDTINYTSKRIRKCKEEIQNK